MIRRASTRPRAAAIAFCVTALIGASCGGGSGSATGPDIERPTAATIETVRFADVARDVGIDFEHGAFKFGASGDPFSMMGAGVCWIDIDRDGWLDLFVVNTWTDGEWSSWRDEGALPTSRLYRNDQGRFEDVSDQWGAALEVRGSGCVAADLDLDGFADLYVTSDRQNMMLWNDGGERFETDDGSAGIDASGWHAGAAVGDVNGDGWPDLFVAGYADPNRPIPEATRGFPNSFEPVRDLLYLSRGGDGERPTFVDVASDAGIESDQLDYGLGAVLTDVDRDGDLDLYVAADTQPNRLYVNEADDGPLGFRLVDQGPAAGVAGPDAGMGIAVGDFSDDGRPDLVVTNMAGQGHEAYRSAAGADPLGFDDAVKGTGLSGIGQTLTGWGTTWADVDLDGDLDLIIAHGAIPVTDIEANREQIEVFANLARQDNPGRFDDATSIVGLDGTELLARGMAAADFDNDGDVDLAVATVGGHLALLRNSGAGGHWLLVAPEPATPGTIVTVSSPTRPDQEREVLAGSSYLSSEDPRAHFGLGGSNEPVMVTVRWPDGQSAVMHDVVSDRIITLTPG